MKKYLLLSILLTSQALAQNTITFSTSTTTGDASVTPVLTWSTSPAAQSCTASGASNWAGAKAASGTQTLPAITSDATYNLACVWPGDSIATFSWVNPTQNSNGSAYTDPKNIRIKYTFNPSLTAGVNCSSSEVCIDVPQTPTPTTIRTVTGISQTGTLRARFFAQNQRDVFSGESNVATKVFTGNVTVNRSVGITVNPVPNAPTNGAVE